MRRTIWQVFGTAAIAMLAGVSAAAQEPDPDELADWSLDELIAVRVDSVVGAAKHEQRLTEAAASVTIITANDIRTFGWRTLAEVLQNVRGFYVTDDRNYSYLGVRGFGRPTDYNNRVLVTIDGHRVNDTIYDAAPIGEEFPIDLALVERIEVIRGPGSALYGTGAFFAVINLVTKRGTGHGGEAAFEAGSLDAYRGRATYGWGDGKARDVLVSFTQHGTSGLDDLYFPEFDAPGIGDGRVHGADGERSRSAYLSARLGHWRFQTLAGRRHKEVPTAAWATVFNDNRFETMDQRGWLSAAYERRMGETAFAARTFYDQYEYEGRYPYALEGRTTVDDDRARMDTIGGELFLQRRIAGRHRVTFGVEYRDNLRQDQRYIEEGVATVDSRMTSRQGAVMFQDEITLAPRWTAVLGARYDWWSDKGSTGRPRLGLIYRTDYDTALKVLYGEAYRVPTMYELYYFTPDSRAQGLRPESLKTTEVVFEQYLRGRVRLAATAYSTWIRDLIDSRPGIEQDAIIFVNEESARARGFELEAEGRWSSGVLVRGSYAVADAHDRRSGETLSNAPHQLAALQISVPAWQRQLRVSSNTTATSWRHTVLGTRLPGYTLTNVTVRYEPLRSRLHAGLTVYNVFDTTYAHPVGLEFVQQAIEQNGRTFAVRGGVRF